MEPTTDQSKEPLKEKASLAILELAKGIKNISFYPEGHPSLVQSIWKIVSTSIGSG